MPFLPVRWSEQKILLPFQPNNILSQRIFWPLWIDDAPKSLKTGATSSDESFWHHILQYTMNFFNRYTTFYMRQCNFLKIFWRIIHKRSNSIQRIHWSTDLKWELPRTIQNHYTNCATPLYIPTLTTLRRKNNMFMQHVYTYDSKINILELLRQLTTTAYRQIVYLCGNVSVSVVLLSLGPHTSQMD